MDKKPVWEFEKLERELSDEEKEDGVGTARIETRDTNGPVTYGCFECARLRAWMRSLAARGEVEETLPKVTEFVACWKARLAHESEAPHVAFGWAFDAHAVKVANERMDDPTTGPFWREFKSKYLMPRAVE